MKFTKEFIINNKEYLNNVCILMGFIYNIKNVTSNKEKKIESKVTVEFNNESYSMPEGYIKLYTDVWEYLDHNLNNKILCIFKVNINNSKDEKEVSDRLQKYVINNIEVLTLIAIHFFQKMLN